MLKACSGMIREDQGSLLRHGILSSASFWRGNQVDGLPRRPTLERLSFVRPASGRAALAALVGAACASGVMSGFWTKEVSTIGRPMGTILNRRAFSLRVIRVEGGASWHFEND